MTGAFVAHTYAPIRLQDIGGAVRLTYGEWLSAAAAGLALEGLHLLRRRLMLDPAGSNRHEQVSGRSPELTAKGAQRPSGLQTGLGQQAHIGHPVLVHSG
jgi:hypothetical protein